MTWNPSSLSDLALLRLAVKRGWPVAPRHRAKLARAVLEAADGDESVRRWIAANVIHREGTMEFHEAANIFPLDEEHLDDLAADIKEHGQRIPVEIMDGKILDGRRRWLACEKAGVDAESVEVHPDDPVAYVKSLNLHRRHLTISQLAMVAGRADALSEKYKADAKSRQRAAGGDKKSSAAKSLPVNCSEAISKGDTRDQVGKVFGVSGKMVDQGPSLP